MNYRNVFTVTDDKKKVSDFIYCLYVMFTEAKDEDIKDQIESCVEKKWSENKPHIIVTDLMIEIKDDVLKQVVSYLYPKEDKEKDNDFYLGFLTDESEVPEVGLSDFQKQAVVFYSKLID